MCEIYPGEFEAMEYNGRMDAIDPSDKLSKKEIDTMLNALAEGEDFPNPKYQTVDFPNPMYYPQVDEITPTVVAEPIKDGFISRRAVNDIIYYEIGDLDLMRKVQRKIDKLPSIHMGKWLRTSASGTLYCSECDEVPKIQRETAKCPNCGAIMEVSD